MLHFVLPTLCSALLCCPPLLLGAASLLLGLFRQAGELEGVTNGGPREGADGETERDRGGELKFRVGEGERQGKRAIGGERKRGIDRGRTTVKDNLPE